MLSKCLKYKDSATDCTSLDKECVSKLVIFSNTVKRELIVLSMDNKVFNFTDGFLKNLQNVYEKQSLEDVFYR